jgi:tRNA wybutosine-synthesizing protein 3
MPELPNVEILPSFNALQRKTKQTLYAEEKSLAGAQASAQTSIHNGMSQFRDKSPKGSVDEPIQHLVDLINRHSHYCTLSSCSGRLSLFNPNGKGTNTNSTNEHGDFLAEEGSTASTRNKSTTMSGKGRGGWVLVSHEAVPHHVLVDALQVDDPQNGDTAPPTQDFPIPQKAWIFKVEPMLLHVAAASLHHGRLLLRLALDLGFRESGLVVTHSRVTVAIRSHSLALAVPLWPSGLAENNECTNSEMPSAFQVPSSYLRALVQEGNQRLQSNWRQLEKLYQSIERSLFQIQQSPPSIILRHSTLPRLNLWNVTAVADTSQALQTLSVIGGYGCGPSNSNYANVRGARRSSKVYQIDRSLPDGSWKQQWQTCNSNAPNKAYLQVPLCSQSTAKVTEDALLEVSYPTQPTDIQGTVSCRLQPSGLVVLWGGRRGPSKPCNTLYVLDNQAKCLAAVCTVSGEECPRPRWGHELIAFGEGNKAILLGGCNHEVGVMDDVFVLHLTFNEQQTLTDGKASKQLCHFHWEKLRIRLPTPRFHFGASLVQGNIIVVVGGLLSTTNLLPCDAVGVPNQTDSQIFAIRIDDLNNATSDEIVCPTSATIIKTTFSMNSCDSSHSKLAHVFGMSCCSLLSNQLLLVTGGTQGCQDLENSTSCTSPLYFFWISNGLNDSELYLHHIPHRLCCADVGKTTTFDFASLVHHCCIDVSDSSVILVGGGVPSFSFGEQYAQSYYLEIDIHGANTSVTKISDPTMAATDDFSNQAQDTTANENQTKESTTSHVVYVEPANAKEAKDALLDCGYLDKCFRMIKTPTKAGVAAVAIPITAPYPEIQQDIESTCNNWILEHGQLEMPFSTSQYAKGAQ